MHGKAKENTEIDNEKEIIEMSAIQAVGQNKYGDLVESELQQKLNSNTGEGKTEVIDNGDNLVVNFIDSQRYYEVDINGNVSEPIEVIVDNNPGDITVGINGESLDGKTEETAYQIWCIEDLVAFSNMVNGEGIKLVNGKAEQITKAENFNGKYVVLKTNLNFKSKLSYENSERTDFGDINGNENDGNTLMNEMTTGTGFKPIGIGNSFAGNFDGNNNKISNVFIQTSSGYTGLFGTVSNAIIKNTEILGEIKGETHTGGIVGEIRGGGIINCINRANIEGKNMAGGIVGYAVSSTVEISKCNNYGSVNNTASWWAYSGNGGILGCSGSDVNIKNCENYGEIGKEDTSMHTGGIIGVINSTSVINDCNNFGKIKAKTNTGGIVGLYRWGSDVKLYNNSNFENIYGVTVGGIIGSCNLPGYTGVGTCYIENCYNIGNLTSNGSGNLGGIIGKIGGGAYKDMKIYVNNCYNIGNLTGNIKGGAVGGISNNGHGEKAQYLYTNNVYYLIDTADNGIGKGNVDGGEINSIDNVNTTEFVDILNNYKNEEEQYPLDWKKWKLGEDGYPVFE